MSPARRKRLAKLKFSKKKKDNSFLRRLLLLLGIVFLVFIFVVLTTHFWEKDSKLSVVFLDQENVSITVFDPTSDSITTFTIPGDTQVQVARQLGTWRLKSVWRLGENEGHMGQLLAETVTNHIGLPVFAWADMDFAGFKKGNPISVVKALFGSYDTNLGFGDRLRIFIFSSRVKSFKRKNIDFSESGFLEKLVLIDGEEGYVISKRIPDSIFAVFSDPLISKSNVKVEIVEATKTRGIGEEAGEIVQTLGAKVTSIKKEEASDTDCLVIGENRLVVERISLVFNCETQISDTDFDVQIVLGDAFVKRF